MDVQLQYPKRLPEGSFRGPRLNFACELASADLVDLFADGSVAEQLVALGATVTLGLLDLSAERAAVARRLTTAGIPVYLWLLLPTEQGHWFSANNASFAVACHEVFQAWTAEHNLLWAGVGIDVEPDFREIQRLLADRWALFPTLLRRILDDRARRQAAAQYAALVARVRADGYPVHSYELPFLEDERAAGSTLLRRILGLVEMGTDREIPMLYTILMGARGVGLLWSYGHGKAAIIAGSTGGGASLGRMDQAALTWDELARDLRLAARRADDVGIFSLEGCVRQRSVERLRDFDWESPVALPTAEAAMIERRRAVARAFLWVTARPYVLLGLPGPTLALRWSRHHERMD